MSDTPIEQGEQGWSDWQRSPYDEAFYRDRPADDGVGTITNYLSLDYLNALEADNAHLREQVARQRVWAQVGMRGKAEDDQANADKLVAINQLVADLEAERDALAAQAGEQG